MKKLFFIMLFGLMFDLYAYSMTEGLIKYNYNSNEVIECMKKYHTKYGKGDIDYDDIYETIEYWASYYDVDLAFAMSFFAIESGFTYECVSHFGAKGMGQLTEVALIDFNEWFNKDISISDLNDKNKYEINVMVSLGYLRMCWDRYKIIENGEDLVKSYNVGVGNLSNIKKGVYEPTNKWIVSANNYTIKFTSIHSDFKSCRR